MKDLLNFLVACGVVIGGIDKLCGYKRGYGKKFDEAFSLLAPTAFSMVGILCLSPYIALAVRTLLSPLCRLAGIDPGMLAGLLPIDMGGYQLAGELADNQVLGQYAGLGVSSTLGCTLAFTIPVGASLLPQTDQEAFAKGVVIGLLGLPVSLFTEWVLLCDVSVRLFLQQNAIPLLIAAAGGIGLWKFTDKALWLFQKYVRLLQLILTVGLMLGAVAYLCRLPLNIVPVLDAMNTVSGIAIFLLGSLPLVLLLQRLLNRPLTALGNRLQIGEDGIMGLLIGAVSPLPTLSMMSRMNETAKVINAAFLVSGASALGAHLAFVYSVNPQATLTVLCGKLLGGCFAALLACGIVRTTGRN